MALRNSIQQRRFLFPIQRNILNIQSDGPVPWIVESIFANWRKISPSCSPLVLIHHKSFLRDYISTCKSSLRKYVQSRSISRRVTSDDLDSPIPFLRLKFIGDNFSQDQRSFGMSRRITSRWISKGFVGRKHVTRPTTRGFILLSTSRSEQ